MVDLDLWTSEHGLPFLHAPHVYFMRKGVYVRVRTVSFAIAVNTLLYYTSLLLKHR